MSSIVNHDALVASRLQQYMVTACTCVSKEGRLRSVNRDGKSSSTAQLVAPTSMTHPFLNLTRPTILAERVPSRHKFYSGGYTHSVPDADIAQNARWDDTGQRSGVTSRHHLSRILNPPRVQKPHRLQVSSTLCTPG